MLRGLSLLSVMVLAAGAGVFLGVTQLVPNRIMAPIMGSMMFVAGLAMSISTWRDPASGSRERRRMAVYLAAMTVFSISMFLSTGVAKSILQGISIVLIFGVIVDRRRARRRRAAA